jgi:hypothetical protein
LRSKGRHRVPQGQVIPAQLDLESWLGLDAPDWSKNHWKRASARGSSRTRNAPISADSAGIAFSPKAWL